MAGIVEKVFVTPHAGGRLLPVASVQLEANKGIVGDRYHAGSGTFSKDAQEPRQNLTLIEAEEIEEFNKTHDAQLGYGEFRRNVITRGIKLNTLVGKVFQINGIKVKGLEACEPCAHLAELAHPAVLPDMVHRAGLRAAIIGNGEIKVGDAVGLPGEENA